VQSSPGASETREYERIGGDPRTPPMGEP
jgi:hypothetical protein